MKIVDTGVPIGLDGLYMCKGERFDEYMLGASCQNWFRLWYCIERTYSGESAYNGEIISWTTPTSSCQNAGIFNLSVEQKENALFATMQLVLLLKRNTLVKKHIGGSHPPANFMPWWLLNFQEYGTLKIQHRSERPSKTNDNCKKFLAISIDSGKIIKHSWNWFSYSKMLHSPNSLKEDSIIPVQVRLVQEVEGRDYLSRVSFATWCMENIQSEAFSQWHHLFWWMFLFCGKKSEQKWCSHLGRRKPSWHSRSIKRN